MDTESSDHLLTRVLGPNLEMATLRMVVGLAVVSAIVAALGTVLH